MHSIFMYTSLYQYSIHRISIFSISISGQTDRQQELYLGGGSSIDDGLHEDAEVGVVLLGAIPFDADAQPGGTRVAEGDLEGQELSGPVWSEDQVVLLGFLLQKGARTGRALDSKAEVHSPKSKFNHRQNICEISQRVKV